MFLRWGDICVCILKNKLKINKTESEKAIPKERIADGRRVISGSGVWLIVKISAKHLNELKINVFDLLRHIL